MANERLTENIVRDHFKLDPLFSSVKFEEQKSTNMRIAECLATASKSGKDRPGKPEFIITFPTQSSDYLIVIECKAKTDKHESANHDRAKDFAVDGVLHYAKFLSVEFNVVAIAVSGESSETIVVSNFLHKKGDEAATELPDKKLLGIYDYVKTFRNEQLNYNLKDVNIVEKAVKLNDDFHSCSISESMRNTLVSGILLALQDNIFCASYKEAASSKDLAEDVLIPAIRRVLSKAKVRKLEDMMGVYSKILDEPLVKDIQIKKKKKPTVSLGGTYVLSSFVQPTEFYTAQNVAVLRPLVEMSIQEKLFYCMCISANRFRYSAFGREANRTLKYLEVPTREEIPEWVSSATIPDYSHIKKSYSQCEFDINSVPHGQFRICQLFNIEYPKSLVYSNTTPQKGGINFVSSKATDNGVVGTVEKIGGVKIYPAGCITVPLKGSVLEPALQEAECYVAHQIAVLTPKNLMSTLSKLYMCTLIKANRYRFNYGRQADKTLKDLELSLPITENGDVNYSAIETYMQSLPYSNNYV